MMAPAPGCPDWTDPPEPGGRRFDNPFPKATAATRALVSAGLKVCLFCRNPPLSDSRSSLLIFSSRFEHILFRLWICFCATSGLIRAASVINCFSCSSTSGSGFVRRWSGTTSWLNTGTRPSVCRMISSSRSGDSTKGMITWFRNSGVFSCFSTLFKVFSCPESNAKLSRTEGHVSRSYSFSSL